VFTALVFLPLLAVIGYVMFSLNVNFNVGPLFSEPGSWGLPSAHIWLGFLHRMSLACWYFGCKYGATCSVYFSPWEPVCVARTTVQAWPKDATTGFYALLFHGLIAALLSLYLFFWLKWDLANTLPVALALGAALAFVGHRALSGLATARLQTASKRD
jgi:hypothetical protein